MGCCGSCCAAAVVATRDQEPLPSVGLPGAGPVGPVELPRHPELRLTMTVATMTDSPEWEVAEPGVPSQVAPPLERREGRKCLQKTKHLEVAVAPLEDGQDSVTLETPTSEMTGWDFDALFDDDTEEDLEQPESLVEDSVECFPRPVGDGHVFEDSLDHFEEPGPPTFQVARHATTLRKLVDWQLEVRVKWLFIGDSNLSYLPDFTHKCLQVDSFPEAHFRHAQVLMQKARVLEGLVVEKLVLSFGMFSRGNDPRVTTVRNLQAALRTAKEVFPYSEIYIPLVNLTPTLPAVEQDNLCVLKGHIKRNMPHIPELPSRWFRTGSDGVQWTAETGRYIFDHWMQHLNCVSP